MMRLYLQFAALILLTGCNRDPAVKPSSSVPTTPKDLAAAPGFLPDDSPEVELSGDGETMRLLHEFAFNDPTGTNWKAPSRVQEPDFKADGASIPRIFWTAYGSPLRGKYRNASIIHDYYCYKHKGVSSQVHRMFYQACLHSGLEKRKAAAAYYAVMVGGPYWGDESHLTQFWSRARTAIGFGSEKAGDLELFSDNKSARSHYTNEVSHHFELFEQSIKPGMEIHDIDQLILQLHAIDQLPTTSPSNPAN